MSCKCLSEFLTVSITLLGVIIATISFIIALKQYIDGNRFKKAAFFMDLRRRFKENADFRMIREMIETGEIAEDLNITLIYDYAGFFEELQIAINSGYIKSEMVYYLFGHYIISFDNANLINREAPLWAAFNQLVQDMRLIQNVPFEYNNNLIF